MYNSTLESVETDLMYLQSASTALSQLKKTQIDRALLSQLRHFTVKTLGEYLRLNGVRHRGAFARLLMTLHSLEFELASRQPKARLRNLHSGRRSVKSGLHTKDDLILTQIRRIGQSSPEPLSSAHRARIDEVARVMVEEEAIDLPSRSKSARKGLYTNDPALLTVFERLKKM